VTIKAILFSSLLYIPDRSRLSELSGNLFFRQPQLFVGLSGKLFTIPSQVVDL
jgi:hypothetical protein